MLKSIPDDQIERKPTCTRVPKRTATYFYPEAVHDMYVIKINPTEL